MLVSFALEGLPRAQGSVSFFKGHAVAVPAKLQAWREAVRAAGVDALFGGAPLAVPVEVTITLYLHQPQRPRWPVPGVRPDLDKLVRAVLDGISCATSAHGLGVIADDSLVVDLHAKKRYGPPGARILVAPYGGG